MDPNLLAFFLASGSGATPDIEFIGAGSAASTSITVPAGHAEGDLIVMIAHQDGNTTPAAPDGTWTLELSRVGFSSKNYRVYQKIATSGSETSGTWTNTDGLHCLVYRYASGIGTTITNGSSSATVTIPGLTLSVTDGTSWVLAFEMHLSASGASIDTLTARTNRSSGLNWRAQTWDTDAGVSSFSIRNSDSGSEDYQAAAIEILKA